MYHQVIISVMQWLQYLQKKIHNCITSQEYRTIIMNQAAIWINQFNQALHNLQKKYRSLTY